MGQFTLVQARYFAEQLLLNRSQTGLDGLVSAMSGVKVDLNPHQVDAALFALRSPLSNGALLADEVGLGKTIEAGLVIAQFWSERKRRILLIMPASLRTQWRTELEEKFFIKSTILETSNYNKIAKQNKNPFDNSSEVIICSYNFASGKQAELSSIPWDLVVIDEAHRLRNTYKKNNVMGNRLREALSGKRKLLLTATPLQNNLMELYGLTSIIDEHIFGDTESFKEMFVSDFNETIRNTALRNRLQFFCKRTLRRQVTEYVKYTNRTAILQEYTPTKDEEELYNQVSEYLQREDLYALPSRQRTLITLVARKLLASSSFAIAGTLESFITRLEKLKNGEDTNINTEDYDIDEDEKEEWSKDDLDETAGGDIEGIESELKQLRKFEKLAKSIKTNSKGENLIYALKKGFDSVANRGGKRKAVIFTESRRTQDYLLRLLSEHGYKDKIVFLNGTNTDEGSKKIYAEWKKRHANDGMISGSRTADMKSAVVEEFRDRASILIGTEAAAEGINLQFCCILVNYDMPWNPQRIEQRIGRCHRYGQKNDVVVINFVNQSNEADKRVYELLNKKFKLFEGLFGSSDEVIGTIESGVDFEKRVLDIFQRCKSAPEIDEAFNNLQDELSDKINEKMTAARQSILENFDEDVVSLLKTTKYDTERNIDRFGQWLRCFVLAVDPNAEALDPLRIKSGSNILNLNWKSAEDNGEIFLRRDLAQVVKLLSRTISEKAQNYSIELDYCGNPHIGWLDVENHREGSVIIDKLTYTGIETIETLVVTAVTKSGEVIDSEMIDKLMTLPGKVTATNIAVQIPEKLIADNKIAVQLKIDEENKKLFIEETEKLDAWSEELKNGLQRELKTLRKTISERKKALQAAKTTCTLAEMLSIKDEINNLESSLKKKQRDLYAEEDRIEAENERLQEETRTKLTGIMKAERVISFTYKINCGGADNE
jgi:ERCC4-related helicase